ncbi:OLC1v1000113C1 [Oldenlandia corymbosa var. corymbosa]|uniref:OLC1v1000113C1 n=1 Tax=Oldenlandia corymbosa var. corymbosa TaxID=529605 RepID=A0AAV1D334_OLDCO|nr:OLC1v1000113C1 [Oldenlandia corymbosa var. corymbosa]
MSQELETKPTLVESAAGVPKTTSTADPRDAVWLQRRKLSRRRNKKGFNDLDIEEIEGALELGFELDSPDVDPKLFKVFPALEFYRSVTTNSCNKFFNVDDPEEMKVRLRQWAKVVECSVRHPPSTPPKPVMIDEVD